MNEYLQANQRRWDQLTIEHEKSAFYELAGFRAGKDRLPPHQHGTIPFLFSLGARKPD